MEKLWIDAPEFDELGGFVLESQFVGEMGQSYLMADSVGTVVSPATVKFSIKESGMHRFFVRTKNWCTEYAPDGIVIEVDGDRSAHVCGKMHVNGWYFEIAGDFDLSVGEHVLRVHDTDGWFGRFSCVIITNDYDFYPSRDVPTIKKQRRAIKGIKDEARDMGHYDLIVAGGGVAGVMAAVSAARYGLKTALINNRPRLGGNGSEESSVTLDGSTHIGEHETGLVFEMKCYRETNQFTWSHTFEEFTSREKNLDVFHDTLVVGADTENGYITKIRTVNNLTLEEQIFCADRFVDSTGDAWLGYYAGASYRVGREAKFQHGEAFAPDVADGNTMSGCAMRKPLIQDKSICAFCAEPTDSPVTFTPPEWGFKLPDGDELGRTPGYMNRGEWWLELQNDYDDIFEGEFVRDSMFRMAVGYFDWLKNSWPDKEKAANYKLCSLGTYLARRESRRLVGDYILSENDYVEGKTYPDTVGFCGWNIDVHHINGIFSGKEGRFTINRRPPLSPFPLSALYSKNIDNLMMAGRCISVTHIGLGAVRVQLTTATMGQVVGTTAYLCKKYACTPREIRDLHIAELQQLLIKDGMTVPGVTNTDEADLARIAKISADSYVEFGEPQNVVNGKVRKREGADYAWISEANAPQSITFEFNKESEIRQIRITFDFPFEKFGYGHSPYPEIPNLVTDFTISVLISGVWKEVKTVNDNIQRLAVIDLDPIAVNGVRITVLKLVNSDKVIIPEVRIY